jgi:hypothetical protein
VPLNRVALLRVALVLFVLAWVFGPYQLRSAIPVWVVFLVALGLELQFFLMGGREGEPAEREPGPQPIDLERFGYLEEEDDGDEDAERYEEHAEAAVEEEPPALRWRPARALTGLAVLAAVGLVLWLVEARTGWDALPSQTRTLAQARFSEEASRIAGKPVTIRCDEAGRYVGAIQHADGVATVGGDLAYLTPQRCLDLYRLAFKGEIRGSRTGRAIAVLAHEAWHLRGIRNEGRTECNALRSGVELGRRLGLATEDARALMRQQRAENALRADESPEYLLPADC